MKIGIFWIYRDTVIGKFCAIEQGSESINGLIDTDFGHYESWELKNDLNHVFPELAGTEYQKYPRGRVLFSSNERRFYVYLDKQLNNHLSKTLIREYFCLQSSNVKWLLDNHYEIF